MKKRKKRENIDIRKYEKKLINFCKDCDLSRGMFCCANRKLCVAKDGHIWIKL